MRQFPGRVSTFPPRTGEPGISLASAFWRNQFQCHSRADQPSQYLVLTPSAHHARQCHNGEPDIEHQPTRSGSHTVVGSCQAKSLTSNINHRDLVNYHRIVTTQAKAHTMETKAWLFNSRLYPMLCKLVFAKRSKSYLDCSPGFWSIALHTIPGSPFVELFTKIPWILLGGFPSLVPLRAEYAFFWVAIRMAGVSGFSANCSRFKRSTIKSSMKRRGRVTELLPNVEIE
ncbi:hypothetical protein SELMODRAFT_428779 [Selaginella moellendorffii]|uniref:Uncharacterized protein n=1 Tax=Selaginella moellendorffii TaxID=88036 RepID=D8T3Z2_SELML|nr:hypothetical protein SELMODRAFT_428779 [Selaginella moellendorffii]